MILLYQLRIPFTVSEESTLQMRTDSTRTYSKRVRKFSLANGSIIKAETPSSSYRVNPVTNKKKGTGGQRGQYHRGPLLFSKVSTIL